MRAVQRLREQRRPGVLVTVMSVRGHAPRDAGAKMVVAEDHVWATVGGGNLESVAVERARELLAASTTDPEMLEFALSDKAPYQHGVQCCGGEVRLLLEPLPVVPSVAIFGMGHVGLELARILARHDVELHLVDSRPGQLVPERLSVLDDAVANVHVHHVPVLPELVVGELPPGTHALVMTHDHAEDAALCDAALRNGQLATIGLIGSSAKWSRFRRKLADDGLPAEAIDKITIPIGLPGLPGKEPATIAVSVAAWLLQLFTAERSVPPDQLTTAERNAAPAPLITADRRPASAQREAKA
ncbi:xanthine dehydrogenase accessory protein XdhC [Kribbella caucasensis]|nr:xanthine dehydrogenase accessory protein XdhC [Kribbella sp. VKM Ac-2527]